MSRLIQTNWLAASAAMRPGAAAAIDQAGDSLSYSELIARAGRAARAISEGVAPGGRCALDLPPSLELIVAINAAAMAGRAFQVIRQGLPVEERESALQAADAELVVDADWLEATRSGPSPGFMRPPAAAGVLSRVLSSGTSGPRKPIDLTYANHAASAAASAQRLGSCPGDRWLCCMPLDHVGGLCIPIRSVISGGTVSIHDGFDVGRVADEIDRGSVELISLVPTQLQRLLREGVDLSGPRAVLLGGAPATIELVAEAFRADVALVATYGMTEACSQITTITPAEIAERPGSVGRPLDGVELQLAAGEILVRGENVAPGSRDADGWLHTGDLGRVDDDGYLWIEGRRGDLIITGGENVNPDEVEAALLSHPAVADAGVVGFPDAEWGEAVTAFVVAADGAGPEVDVLREHCRRLLAPFKVPKRIEPVRALPRTASGKLLRRELR